MKIPSLQPLRGLLSQSSKPAQLVSVQPHLTSPWITPSIRSLHTTQTQLKPPTSAKKPTGGSGGADRSRKAGGKHGSSRSENYQRIKILKQNLFSPAPPPLRMARLRHLRHWTIHRAWLLFRRKQQQELLQERERMHWGMFNACEELRKTVGPGSRGEGYLYRVALEKKGVWHADAVPIEYARGQTDSPAKMAWDHDWKR